MIYFPIFPSSPFRNSKFLSCSCTDLSLFHWYSVAASLLAEVCVFQASWRNLLCLGTHCMDVSNSWWPAWCLLDSRLPWTTRNHLRRWRQWCSLLRARAGTAAPCWKISTRMLISWQNSGALLQGGFIWHLLELALPCVPVLATCKYLKTSKHSYLYQYWWIFANFGLKFCFIHPFPCNLFYLITRESYHDHKKQLLCSFLLSQWEMKWLMEQRHESWVHELN